MPLILPSPRNAERRDRPPVAAGMAAGPPPETRLGQYGAVCGEHGVCLLPGRAPPV